MANLINKTYVTTKQIDLYKYDSSLMVGSNVMAAYQKSKTVPAGTYLKVGTASAINTGYTRTPIYNTDKGIVIGRANIGSLKEKQASGPGIISASFFKENEQTIYGIGFALFLLFFFKVGPPKK